MDYNIWYNNLMYFNNTLAYNLYAISAIAKNWLNFY